jgi:hypothetical protein
MRARRLPTGHVDQWMAVPSAIAVRTRAATAAGGDRSIEQGPQLCLHDGVELGHQPSKPSAIAEQLGHPAAYSGPNMKW